MMVINRKQIIDQYCPHSLPKVVVVAAATAAVIAVHTEPSDEVNQSALVSEEDYP